MGNLTQKTNVKPFNGLTPIASNCLPNPTCNRYKQAIKKKSTMTLTSNLRKIRVLKIKNNEKENISLTLFLQFDTLIARRQVVQRKQKFSFSPIALKRVKQNQPLKARVMQATQSPALPKLTLHMLFYNYKINK